MAKYAIDIDGVVFDFVGEFIKYLKDKHNRTILRSEITHYYWYECIPWISKESFWSDFHDFGKKTAYKTIPHFKDSEFGIKTLINNADVYIVTHRPEYTYESTVEIFGNLGIPKDKIIFSRGTKSLDISRLEIDAFIDDAKHNVFDVVENTRARVYLMDHMYNRDFSHENVIRVNNWHEFLAHEGIIK